jgi:hypothetical protein
MSGSALSLTCTPASLVSGRTSLDVGCYMQTEGRLYHADGSKSSTKRDARGHIDPVVLRSGRRLRDRLDGSITHLGGSHVRSSRPILDLGAPVEDMNRTVPSETTVLVLPSAVGSYGGLVDTLKLLGREPFRRQVDEANTHSS